MAWGNVIITCRQDNNKSITKDADEIITYTKPSGAYHIAGALMISWGGGTPIIVPANIRSDKTLCARWPITITTTIAHIVCWMRSS